MTGLSFLGLVCQNMFQMPEVVLFGGESVAKF